MSLNMWSRYVLRLTDTRLGSAVVGVLATAAVGVMIVALSTLVLGTYGFALFVATPAFLGFFSALAHGLRSPRSSGDAIAVGSLTVALASLALIAASLEGAICVVMALPLTLGLGVIGALAGHAVQQRVGRHARMHALSMIALLVQWTRSDRRTAKRLDRAADRDDDADLAAYNRMLAELAKRDAR